MNADYLFVPFTPDCERRRDYHITDYAIYTAKYMVHLFNTCRSQRQTRSINRGSVIPAQKGKYKLFKNGYPKTQKIIIHEYQNDCNF